MNYSIFLHSSQINKSCQLSNSVDQKVPKIKCQHICNNTSLVTQKQKRLQIFLHFMQNQLSCQLSSIVEKGFSQHGSIEIRSGFNNPQDPYPVLSMTSKGLNLISYGVRLLRLNS